MDDSSSAVCSTDNGVPGNDNSSGIVHSGIVLSVNLSFSIKLDRSNYLNWKE